MKDSALNIKPSKFNKHLVHTILVFASVSLTIVSQPSLAGDYLSELANEAEATANVVTSSQLDSAEQQKFKKMEALLETERPSTYTFYKKLYPKNKERVFKYFENDESSQNDRLSHLQKQVMDVYFSQ